MRSEGFIPEHGIFRHCLRTVLALVFSVEASYPLQKPNSNSPIGQRGEGRQQGFSLGQEPDLDAHQICGLQSFHLYTALAAKRKHSLPEKHPQVLHPRVHPWVFDRWDSGSWCALTGLRGTQCLTVSHYSFIF